MDRERPEPSRLQSHRRPGFHHAKVPSLDEVITRVESHKFVGGEDVITQVDSCVISAKDLARVRQGGWKNNEKKEKKERKLTPVEIGRVSFGSKTSNGSAGSGTPSTENNEKVCKQSHEAYECESPGARRTEGKKVRRAKAFVRKSGGNLLEQVRSGTDSQRRIRFVRDRSVVPYARAEKRLGGRWDGGWTEQSLVSEGSPRTIKAKNVIIHAQPTTTKQFKSEQCTVMAKKDHVSYARDDLMEFIALSQTRAPRRRDVLRFWRSRRVPKATKKSQTTSKKKTKGNPGHTLRFGRRKRKAIPQIN